MQRFGQIIGLKPESIAAYEELHANAWPEVLTMITSCNLRNYTIFRHDTLLFAYFEYVGDDFAHDMACMGENLTNQAWWKVTEPMQEPLPDRKLGEWWTAMSAVFHID